MKKRWEIFHGRADAQRFFLLFMILSEPLFIRKDFLTGHGQDLGPGLAFFLVVFFAAGRGRPYEALFALLPFFSKSCMLYMCPATKGE
jgi:hypothetical protein